MKHRFLYIVLLLLTSAIGVWAQEPDPEPINLTSNANGTEWTLAEMPAYHVKLEVEYYPVVKRTTTGENPTDYYYLSLAETIAAAQDGETITMLDDENLGTTSVTINKNVTIDLNGHTLTYTGTQYALTVYNYKTVIIQASGTGENPGGISCTANGWIILNSGTLTISGGAFSSSYPSIDNYGTLTVEGGSITSSNDDAIYNQGSLTVNGGSITGYSGINSNGYYNPSLTITGGSITATNEHGNAILIQTGTFNLSGNPTISGADAAIYLASGMVINIDAALAAPASAWTVKSYNISGAPTTPYTFTSGWSTNMGTAAPAAYFTYYDNTAGVATHLTRGGEAQFVIPNVSITTVGDNPTTLYYPTLAAAIAGASSTSVETITMLADEDLGTTGVTINKNVTLDLNGHTLTCSNTAGEAITVSAGKTVTIQDSGTNGTVSNSLGDAICNKGTLIISSGSITGKNRAITNDENASLTVNGGTITGINQSGVYNYGTNANLTVTGGTITGTSDYAICINSGTFNLSGNPTISGADAAIYLGPSKVITINDALTAPMTTGETPVADPWTVKSDNITSAATTPYTFTSGWSTNMSTADPATYFACTAAGITTRLASNEGQFVQYVELAEATKPLITNNGQANTGTRTPSLDLLNVWVGDELSASTTATPADGITWQWYRVSGTTEDPIETPIDGATASTYTLTAADWPYTVIAKATMAANAAGTGYPATDVTVASTDKASVYKKVNFNELTDVTYTVTDGKVDYIGVEITNPDADVEYLVVPSVMSSNELTIAWWEQATPGTAATNGKLTLNQFVNESTNVSLHNMLPGQTYKLYYRYMETADTERGTTATTNEKPVNEKVAEITTKTFDYLVTTQGVTYKISENPTATVTATVQATNTITMGEGTGDHKTATILATIPAAEITRADVFTVLGYTITDGFTVSSDLSGITSLTSFGADADHYGQLTVKQTSIYNQLKNKNRESKGSQEGYVIFNYKSGYFTLGDADGGHETVAKGNAITDNLIATLTIDGLTGTDQGSTAFTDADGALPLGTEDYNLGKPMAAYGETVTVTITMPAGFGFVNDTPQITVTGIASPINLTVDTQNSRIYTASFQMPEDDATVAFADGTTIHGTSLTYTYTAPDDTKATVTAGGDYGSSIHVVQELTYTIEPLHTGVDYYALTDLGLTDGVTYSIVDYTDNSVPVTLPTETKVKVTLTAPATFTGDAVTFAPVMTKVAEDISFRNGNTTYKYSDTQGIALHGENAYLKFYTVSSVNGSTVTATEITSKQIPAGTPLIVKNTNGADIIARMDFGTYDAVTVATEFKGTAVAKALNAEGNGPWNWAADTEYYGFNGIDDFIWINAAGDVAAHKCWLEISTGNSAHQLTINWDGNATGLSEELRVKSEECNATLSQREFTTAQWYTLDGRKLDNMPTKKGVYIQNGRKVVIK